MATVNIIFRTDKFNKNSKAPIHFRIIINRKTKYIPTGYSVGEDEWDESNKKIKSNGLNKDHKETIARMNSQISKRYSEIQNDMIELKAKQKYVSLEMINEKIIGKTPKDFLSFADSVVERYRIDNKPGTYSRTASVIRKLKEYKSELKFEEITPLFLKEYEYYLKSKPKPNKINTIHANIKFIRTIFNKAYEIDLIDYSLNPFLRFKLKTEKTKKECLTEEELEKFVNVETLQGTILDLVKDMFIFSSNTGGIRISDMLQLQWRCFDGKNLNFTIKKTQCQISIRVPNRGLTILSKYQKLSEDKNDFIFGMLPKDILLQSAELIDNAISSSTAKINKQLKLIASDAKITKNISFHVARHTFATRALKKGIALEKVSKLLGHANIKETMVYLTITNSELDDAMELFNK